MALSSRLDLNIIQTPQLSQSSRPDRGPDPTTADCIRSSGRPCLINVTSSFFRGEKDLTDIVRRRRYSFYDYTIFQGAGSQHLDE